MERWSWWTAPDWSTSKWRLQSASAACNRAAVGCCWSAAVCWWLGANCCHEGTNVIWRFPGQQPGPWVANKTCRPDCSTIETGTYCCWANWGWCSCNWGGCWATTATGFDGEVRLWYDGGHNSEETNWCWKGSARTAAPAVNQQTNRGKRKSH